MFRCLDFGLECCGEFGSVDLRLCAGAVGGGNIKARGRRDFVRGLVGCCDDADSDCVDDSGCLGDMELSSDLDCGVLLVGTLRGIVVCFRGSFRAAGFKASLNMTVFGSSRFGDGVTAFDEPRLELDCGRLRRMGLHPSVTDSVSRRGLPPSFGTQIDCAVEDEVAREVELEPELDVVDTNFRI